MRPFGALVFGRLGDLVGRKYTFLVTITIMGLSTFLVGLTPGYAARSASPRRSILIALRLLQGLALGGEYGGAATYVAEHAPHGRRGFYTSWIQTTATLGLFLSLLVILCLRTAIGEADFGDLGLAHSVPALDLLLGISIWIRLQPQRIAAVPEDEGRGQELEGAADRSLRQLVNAKIAILALLGGDRRPGRGLVRRPVLRAVLPGQHAEGAGEHRQILIYRAGRSLTAPAFIVFGWLSDKIGRKPIILAGCLLGALTYLPDLHG